MDADVFVDVAVQTDDALLEAEDGRRSGWLPRDWGWGSMKGEREGGTP